MSFSIQLRLVHVCRIQNAFFPHVLTTVTVVLVLYTKIVQLNKMNILILVIYVMVVSIFVLVEKKKEV